MMSGAYACPGCGAGEEIRGGVNHKEDCPVTPRAVVVRLEQRVATLEAALLRIAQLPGAHVWPTPDVAQSIADAALGTAAQDGVQSAIETREAADKRLAEQGRSLILQDQTAAQDGGEVLPQCDWEDMGQGPWSHEVYRCRRCGRHVIALSLEAINRDHLKSPEQQACRPGAAQDGGEGKPVVWDFPNGHTITTRKDVDGYRADCSCTWICPAQAATGVVAAMGKHADHPGAGGEGDGGE